MGSTSCTRCLPLVIGIDDNIDMCTFIDDVHAVHPDLKGHSGMGKGSMVNASKNLGLVTNSSIEIEVASNGECYPKFTWFRCFRIAQVDEIKEDVLLQDNKSCMHLHKNYPFSIGKGSKHVNAWCFFLVDKL